MIASEGSSAGANDATGRADGAVRRVLVPIFRVRRQEMDEPTSQLARVVTVERVGTCGTGIIPYRVHSLRIADQARVEHLQLDTYSVRGLVE